MEVESMNGKREKKELLCDGVVYDVTEWIKRHPGGKVMEIYISGGTDAVHAIQQFHQRSTDKVLKIMKSLPQRTLDSNDQEKFKGANEKDLALTKDFTDLFLELKSEGMFNPSPWHVFKRLLDIFVVDALGIYLLFCHSSNMFLWVLGNFLCSLSAGRAAWLGHEGGHHSMTGIPKLDRLCQSLLYGIFNGLSSSYWQSQHTRHHAMPQHFEHDIDIRTLPLIAFNKKVVKDPKEGKSFWIQYQHWLFLTVDQFLVYWAWVLYLHPVYAFRKRRYIELLCMAFHHYMMLKYFGWQSMLLCTWFTTVYLIGQFSLSHTHLPVTEEPRHWTEFALTHTANIRSSWWVDYWMGYLNYQIEHHLFPTMPQFRLKQASPRVKAFAKKHNLPYHLYDYQEGVAKTFSNLRTVAKELKVN